MADLNTLKCIIQANLEVEFVNVVKLSIDIF